MINSGKTSSPILTEEVHAGDMPSMKRGQISYLSAQDYYANAARRDKWYPAWDRIQFWRREAGQEWPNMPGELGDEYRQYAEERWFLNAELHRKFCEDQERLRNKKERHVAVNNELGPREFTLTFSPGKHFPDNETAKAAMTTAIERLTRYYKEEIIEFHAVGEYTAAGAPHIHGWYHLSGGRKITDKNFRRAYPPWNPKRKLGRGFEGGHHQTIERTSDFAGYAEKHLEEAWHLTNITKDANDPASPSPA